LSFIEIIDIDPTERSYVKVAPSKNNDICPGGASVSSDCIGYKVAGTVSNKIKNEACLKTGCKCGGKVVEYKGDDNDVYVKCQ
jgi:hypothetical protein